METYSQQLANLYQSARLSIKANIKEIGVESTNSNLLAIKVDDERAFNLDSGRYLAEVSEDSLIDNEGYVYNYSSLSYEDLMDLVDWVNTLNKKKSLDEVYSKILDETRRDPKEGK